MEKKEHRRKGKRYPVSWEATVVLEKSDRTLVVNAQTQDISSGGACILSEYEDLKGSVVTLVLAQPPLWDGDDGRTFKLKARIVSSMRGPSPPGFRHGLDFLRSPGDGMDFLDELLKAVATAAQGEGPVATAAPAKARAASTGTSRLAQFRQLAQAKLSEEKKQDTQEEINARVSEALQRAYRYLKDLTEQLNIVQPAYTKGYAIVGVPEFRNLAWESGRADLRMRRVSPITTLCEQVTLNFRISGNKQIRVARESPASDRLKQVLTDNKIDFKARDERNERGSLVRTVFEFACEVRASVTLDGHFDTSRILLMARNVERFGILEQWLAPEAITEASLEEFTSFILGETSRIGPLLLRGA